MSPCIFLNISKTLTRMYKLYKNKNKNKKRENLMLEISY